MDTLFPTRVYQPNPITILNRTTIKFNYRIPLNSTFRRPNFSCKSTDNDFVTRVLRDNPTQVEPKFKIGENVYTLTQKENLDKNNNNNIKFDSGFYELLKRLKFKGNVEKNDENVAGNKNDDNNVYLKDILREYRGKLYVPDQLFGSNLSEEDEFDRSFEALPKMRYDEFVKFMRSDKVKLLTVKEQGSFVSGNGVSCFIVDLKQTPGDKSLHLSKWAMRLEANQAQLLLADYSGPLYEIETRMTSSVGQLPKYPNPVASSISSRIMVEFGMVTIVMTAAAVLVGGFLASAVFAATSFVFVATVYIVWPVVKPFLKIFLGIIFGIVERIWDNIADSFVDGGIFSKLSQIYTFGGVSASLEMLKPIMLVLLTMVLLVRFTLSRRPKNFRKWVCNHLCPETSSM